MATTIHGFGNPQRCRLIATTLVLITLTGTMPPHLTAQNATPVQSPPLQTKQTTDATSKTESSLPPEELGDLQMVRKHYQAAIESYEQVTPKTSSIWNKIGIAYQQLFVNEEARKNYEMALKVNPKNADAMNNLGSVYYSLKEYGHAEHMYRKALKINPKSALIYKNLGTNLLAEDKFKKGWDCYQAALTIDPGIFERASQLRIGEPTPVQKRGAMNYYLAKSYTRVGMPELAVSYLRMAIDEGFTDRKKVLADKEFASLHGVSAFEQLISEQRMQ
jgi:Tfp pilus assembly protein PilF